MPSIPLQPSALPSTSPFTAIFPPSNPLPTLLHTPSGYAILEIQGTINMPDAPPDIPSHQTPVGRLTFPDYAPDSLTESTAWMKRAYLYIGLHQRLTGEVKKLVRPLAVLRKRGSAGADGDVDGEELEVVEIVRWKVLFASRPEPVGE